jgi:hypothetical protein
MAVPYTFSTATAAIPLSQLDSNFATAITIGNTAVQLGNTVTTLNNMTLANVTISSGTITITNVSVTTANVSGTANISTLVVVGNETVGGNTTITGNITAANANVTTNLVLSGGTANGVAYLNTSKQVTTGSALVFDGTNLGVGGAANSYGGYSSLQLSNATNGGIIDFKQGSTALGQVLFNTTQAYIFAQATGIPLLFGVNNAEQMRLTSTGLGIGVTSPVSIFDVNAKGTGTTPNAVKTYTSYMHGSTIGTNVGELTGWGVRYGTIGSTPVWYGARFLKNGVNAASDFTIWTSPDGDVTTLAERVTVTASGNVGIGTTSPSASAILDVQSTTKGVRMPNMTTTQKNAISSPVAGLMVFDTTLAKLCVYSGSAWQTITSI